ncbi:MAG: hypothetical protein CBE33_00405 [Candidatus Pelagibacter sp. TMED273]|nr:MAG: hypothetical protein CBE33_00405 [Candidatus Pelagibacter sp. TMED273]|tara:strand:+ start:5997 stop:6947 length:951 start_codon:yes stop_codon:yes gene_type:complete
MIDNLTKIIKIFFYIFITYSLIQSSVKATEAKIILKVNNSIITNKDIENEINYLIAFNEELSGLESKDLNNIGKNSLLREIIKKDELEKYYDLDEESKQLSKIVRDFYLRINLENEEQFKLFLKNKNVNYDSFKKKISIEVLWNRFIYEKYNKLLDIDESLIKEKLDKKIKLKNEIDSFFISELLFISESKNEFDLKYSKILDNINTIGFDSTARIYSIADSSKYGGEIGWISENQLSKEILDIVQNIELGEFSNPINTPSGFLIILLEDKKKELANLNYDDELKNMLKNERDKQLNQYSSLYYKRIEKKSIINEL